MPVFDSSLDLADYIDHTLLDPLAPPEAIAQLCEEAERFHFPSVCLYPIHVPQAVRLLHQKEPRVGTVIGFPTGATTASVKLYEAQVMLDMGAEELDVVINLGALQQGHEEAVHQEIADICALSAAVPVKAILETTLLTNPQKRLAAELCLDAGAAFLKTSTGWHGGATVDDVKLLKEVTRDRAGIKASGGIRTVEQALALLQAGATRLGTSRGIELLRAREKDSDAAYP